MIASLLPERIDSLPLIGVNAFLPKGGDELPKKIELVRTTEAEKREQIDDVHAFEQARNRFTLSGETDATHLPKTENHDGRGPKCLQDTARERKNCVRSTGAGGEDPFPRADQPCAVWRGCGT